MAPELGSLDFTPSQTFPREDWDSLQAVLLIIHTLIERATSATTSSPEDYERYWDAWKIIQEVRTRCEFVRKVLGHDTFDHDASRISTNLHLFKIRSSRSEDTSRYLAELLASFKNSYKFISSLIFWADGRSEIPLTTISLKEFLEEYCLRFENSSLGSYQC